MLAAIIAQPLWAERTITGTIETADPTILRVTIKTDSGGTESFSVTNAVILRKLSKDDRVEVTVGDDGMVNQISKTNSEQPAKKEPPAR